MDNPTIFGTIERPRRLPDEIAQTIMSAISSGELRIGDKLPSETEMSERFGVARTVVREAVSLLKFDGVVDAKRGVGAFVADRSERTSFRISPACFEKRREIVKLLQLRTSVQSGAAALAAEGRPRRGGACRRVDRQRRASAATSPDGASRPRPGAARSTRR